MDGIAQEANTQPVQEFNSQFFYDLPTDLRYQSVEYMKYSPITAISENGDIRFQLPPRTGPAVYFLKDVLMEVRVNLQNEDGTKIADGKDVSVVNLTPHSMFKRLSVSLGTVSVQNTDNDYYYYKAYIKTLVTNSTSVKHTQLGPGADNFVEDSPGEFDTMGTKNSGYEIRKKPFSYKETSGTTTTTKYYGDDVTYLAIIQHDLVSCDVPVIPGVTVDFEMSLNKKEFLVKTSEASPKYKLKLKELYLHVPIGILSTSLYNSLEASLRNTPVKMHFTRTSISIVEVPTDSTNFTLDTVFSRTQVPSKIIIAFVDTEAFNGSYSKNGYHFRRSWTGESSLLQSTTQAPPPRITNDDDASDIEILNAEERLNELRRDLTNLTEVSTQRRNSVSASIQRFLGIRDSPSQVVNVENLARRIQELEDYLDNIRARSQRPAPPPPPPQEPQEPELSATAEITNFIKGTIMTFNGHPIDSLTQISANSREDAINYCRFQVFTNFYDSPFTNSISYEDFLKGNFMCVYDLSTCSKSNTSFIVPSIRLGDLKFVVEFHKPLKHKVTMVIYQEHPALLTINHARKVTNSFTKI